MDAAIGARATAWYTFPRAGGLPLGDHERGVAVVVVVAASIPHLLHRLSGGLTASVGASFASDRAEGGGVAPGFGGEVAAEAEHVQPAPDAGERFVLAQGPGGFDEPPNVWEQFAEPGVVEVGDAVAEAEVFGGLGGVFGNVGGNGVGGEFAVLEPGPADRLDVDLPLVQALDGTLVIVAAWYDNEQGFSTQLARTAHALARVVAQW